MGGAGGKEIFAIKYCPAKGGEMFAVNGPRDTKMEGFTMDYKTGAVTSLWYPTSSGDFKMPHTLTSSLDYKQIYVGQIGKPSLFRFNVDDSDDETADLGHNITQDKADDDGNFTKSEMAAYMVEDITDDDDGGNSDVTAIVIIVLVTLPIIFFLIGMVYVKLRVRKLREYQDLISNDNYQRPDKSPSFFKGKKLNLGEFFSEVTNAQKGFTRVETRGDSDDEENEELLPQDGDANGCAVSSSSSSHTPMNYDYEKVISYLLLNSFQSRY